MLLDPEDEGNMSLQNIQSHSPKDTMSHPQEPQILQPNFIFLTPSKEILEQYLQIGHNSFLPHFFQFTVR
jgi:hypothetical protein